MSFGDICKFCCNNQQVCLLNVYHRSINVQREYCPSTTVPAVDKMEQIVNNEDFKKAQEYGFFFVVVVFRRSWSNYVGENDSNSTHLRQMEAVVRHDVSDSRDVKTSKRSSNNFVEDFDAEKEKSLGSRFLLCHRFRCEICHLRTPTASIFRDYWFGIQKIMGLSQEIKQGCIYLKEMYLGCVTEITVASFEPSL